MPIPRLVRCHTQDRRPVDRHHQPQRSTREAALHHRPRNQTHPRRPSYQTHPTHHTTPSPTRFESRTYLRLLRRLSTHAPRLDQTSLDRRHPNRGRNGPRGLSAMHRSASACRRGASNGRAPFLQPGISVNTACYSRGWRPRHAGTRHTLQPAPRHSQCPRCRPGATRLSST